MRWVRIPWAPHQTKCSKYSNRLFLYKHGPLRPNRARGDSTFFTKDVRFNFYWTLMPSAMSEGTNLNYFTNFTYLTYLTHSLHIACFYT